MGQLATPDTSFLGFVHLSPELLGELEGCATHRDPSRLASFERFVEECREQLDQKRALIVSLRLPNTPCPFTPQVIRSLSLRMGELLGELLVQNEAGNRSVSVYDRDRTFSMHRGSRYHQTREGGSLHTDNVNIPEPWDYLLFSCLSPALVGGENILVDGIAVVERLRDQFPDALAILESDSFVWEMRGVADKLYNAPVLTYDKAGVPHFRYLRPYMESAHAKAGVELTLEKLYAMDVLDALLESGEFQVRYRMERGDILVNRDAQVFHGRTSFSDALGAVTLDEYGDGTSGKKLKRTMERVWIRR
jgi:alpha-ketoglutarate-dependent taurine dioxygenase